MYSGWDHLTVGFPHSDIHGSKPALGSPWLFAECHVLHRLSVPRHPRNALMTLDHTLDRDKPNQNVRTSAIPRKIDALILRQIRKNLFTMTKSFAPRGAKAFDQVDGKEVSFSNVLAQYKPITHSVCAHQARSTGWWSQSGSNRRPQACKASALPTELWPLTAG